MTRRAAQRSVREAGSSIIFPEGTRRPVGAPPRYKIGVCAGLCRLRRAVPAGRAQFRAVLAAPHLHALSRHADGRVPRSAAAGPVARRVSSSVSQRAIEDATRSSRRTPHATEQAQLFGRVPVSSGKGLALAMVLSSFLARADAARDAAWASCSIIASWCSCASRKPSLRSPAPWQAHSRGCCRTAMALPHDAKLLGERQPAGILHMAAIDDIGQRADALPRLVLEPHRAHHLAIDVGDLLAARR